MMAHIRIVYGIMDNKIPPPTQRINVVRKMIIFEETDDVLRKFFRDFSF